MYVLYIKYLLLIYLCRVMKNLSLTGGSLKLSFYKLTLMPYLQGSNLQFELDSFHGQATVLAALVSISPKLPLGYPAR